MKWYFEVLNTLHYKSNVQIFNLTSDNSSGKAANFYIPSASNKWCTTNRQRIKRCTHNFQ